MSPPSPQKFSKATSKFRRLSLAGQIADSLREGILSGRMTGHLPPERELCGMFNASRPAIRQALHSLQKEGLLHIRRARRPEIIRMSPRGKKRCEGNRVVMLFTEPRNFLGHWTLMAIDELRRMLHDQGFLFDLVMGSKLDREHPQKRLEKLTEQFPGDHWILAGASLAMQEWFAGRPWNVVSMGNVFPHIRIPFVNDDLRGTAYHAAGVFLGLGHKRVVFLMRREGTAGEPGMEEGFLKAFPTGSGAEGRVIRHSGEVMELTRRLEEIYSGHSDAGALLVSHAEDTLTAFHWFLKNGIRVPQDVSLISFQWEGYLERLRPLPAWYYTEPKLHATKLCRLIFNPWGGKRTPRLIFPEFFKNETLGLPKRRA